MASHVDEHHVPSINDHHPISEATSSTRPIFDLRCGGIRVTVERIPYGLLTLISTASALVLGVQNWIVQ